MTVTVSGEYDEIKELFNLQEDKTNSREFKHPGIYLYPKDYINPSEDLHLKNKLNRRKYGDFRKPRELIYPQTNYRYPKTEYRYPKTEYRDIKTEYEPPKREYQPQKRDYRPTKTKYRHPKIESRYPKVEYRYPQTENNYQKTEYNDLKPKYGDPITEYRDPFTEYRDPITEYRGSKTEHEDPRTEYNYIKTEYIYPNTKYNYPKTELSYPKIEYRHPKPELSELDVFNDKIPTYERFSNKYTYYPAVLYDDTILPYTRFENLRSPRVVPLENRLSQKRIYFERDYKYSRSQIRPKFTISKHQATRMQLYYLNGMCS